jgi:hypothetical protein
MVDFSIGSSFLLSQHQVVQPAGSSQGGTAGNVPQVSGSGALDPNIPANRSGAVASPELSSTQSARNKVLAKAITAAGTNGEARKVVAGYQAEIDKMSTAAKADLVSQVKAETASRAVTDKSFMEKYGAAILLAIEVACHGVNKYSQNLWNKAGTVLPGLFGSNQSTAPSDDRSNLIT